MHGKTTSTFINVLSARVVALSDHYCIFFEINLDPVRVNSVKTAPRRGHVT